MTNWMISGEEMANCNCNFGCPCQFSVLPTDGTCEAAVVYDIESGHHGDVDLSGVKAASVYKWPGPIHEGNGEMQLIIDATASAAQKAALETIMTGGDTQEMATMWFVFGAMCPTKHETLTATISVELDRDNRVGKATVDGVFEVEGQPLANIVSGEPHRVRFDLPNGFEFAQAEAAQGRTRTMGGALSLLKNTGTHAHFARLHLSGDGVVRA